MIGVVLGGALIWAGWEHRPSSTAVRRHPSMLLLPALLAASMVQYLSDSLRLVAFALLIPLSVGLSLLERRTGREPGPVVRLDRSIALALALVIWLGIRNFAAAGLDPFTVLGMIAGVLVLLGAGRAWRSGALDSAVAVWSSVTFLGLSLIVGGAIGREWIECRYEFGKCTSVGRLYIGIFNSENTLAFFAAMAATLALQLDRSARRRVLFLLLAGVIFLTGNRTSLVALAALPFGMAVISLTASRDATRRWRTARPVPWLGALVAAAVGIGLASAASSESFSLRGRLWAELLDHVSPLSVAGLGRTSFVDLLARGHFRGHYPHSQYLLLLWFGGLIAVALYAAFIATAWSGIRARTRGALGRACAPFVFILVYGLTELSWNPTGVDSDLWTVVALIAAASGPGARERRLPAVPRRGEVLGARP